MKRLRPVALSRSATCLWPRSSARSTASWHSAALAPLDSSSRTTSCEDKAVRMDRHLLLCCLLARQLSKGHASRNLTHMCTHMVVIGLKEQQSLLPPFST